MAEHTDTLTTIFKADTTHLVDGTKKASSAVAEHARKELKAQREIEQAMAKAAKARADLIGNTRGLVLDPGGAASAGLNKLVASMKFSAVTTGVLSAGISTAGDMFAKFREDAAAARIETDAFNETYRKFSQGNKFVSRFTDTSTLVGKLGEAREQEFHAVAQRVGDGALQLELVFTVVL